MWHSVGFRQPPLRVIEKPPIGSVSVVFEVKIVTAESEQHNKRRKEWNCF